MGDNFDVPATRVEWGLYKGNSQDLGAAMLNSDVVIGIRTGRIKPETGMAWARGSVVSLAGNADAGWEVTIPTRPVVQQSRVSDADSERSETAGVFCWGTIHDRDTRSWAVAAQGLYTWTSANSATGPWWMDGAWHID